MTEEVLFSSERNGLGTITLNRPKALNALTFNMVQAIHQKLIAWVHNPDVQAVLLSGTGSKAFCAGGDIKSLYEARQSPDNITRATQFFATEYKTDLAIAQFPKPIIALLSGIVMGGGVGLSYGATTKIVTETTKWAMPEMAIGFFPDVGGAYFLNRAPGYTGRYLALTGNHINAADALYINAATHFIPQDAIASFSKELFQEQELQTNYPYILRKYTKEPTIEGFLEKNQTTIDQHFAYSTVEEIMESLAQSTTPFATETYHIMSTKSPVSLKVTLKQLIDGESKSLSQCLETDLTLAHNFMYHQDFFEGIRSVVIDKDNSPNYQYKKLADVTDAFVEQFFK